MAKKGKGYIWEPGKAPPPIEPHSVAKHEVVHEYIKRYIGILCSGLRQSELKLTLVDGFAGGGLYRDSDTGDMREGSPMRMLQAVKDGEAEAMQARLRQGIKAPIRLAPEFHFVEKCPQTVNYLKATLIEYGWGDLIDDSVHLHHAEFERICDSVVDSISARGTARRSIFLLDQYGYSDIPFPLIRRILGDLPQAEILFTFATDALTNYLCDQNREYYKRNMERIGLPLDIDALLEAGSTDPNWRFFVESALSRALQQSAGANFFTPFFIVSSQSQRAYWLVHLSNHQRARDAMTRVHWQFQNHFAHYGGPGTRMLGYRPVLDGSLGEQSAFTFDDVALNLTQEALLDELPALIAEHPDGVEFKEFAAHIANETPAHNGILLDVLGQLVEQKLIVAESSSGTTRRVGNALKDTDRISTPRQRFFTY